MAILFSKPNLIMNIYDENFNANINRLTFITNDTGLSKFELDYSYTNGSIRKYYLILPSNIIKFKIKNSHMDVLNIIKVKFEMTIDCFDVVLETDINLCNELRLLLL